MRRIASVGSLAALVAAFSLPALGQAMRQDLFLPDYGTGQTIAATTTTASVTLTGNSLNDSIIRISNAGAAAVFCRAGNGAQTATAADVALLAGTSMIISRPTLSTPINTVACLASTGTATVYVITGNNGY